MKINVCTVLVGQYDFLAPVHSDLKMRKDWNFFCYSDMPVTTDGWISKMLPEKISELSVFLQTRYIKLFCHSLGEEEGLYIYTDSNLDLLPEFVELVDLFNDSRAPLGLIRHPVRSNITEEVEALRGSQKISGRKDMLKNQLEHYQRANDYYHVSTLFENSIIFKISGNRKVDQLMTDWWAELNTWPTRDQISFPYVLSRHSIDYFCFTVNLRASPNVVRFRGHKSGDFKDIHALLHARANSFLFRCLLTVWQPFHNALVKAIGRGI